MIPFKAHRICFKFYDKRSEQEPSKRSTPEPENPWCIWGGMHYLSVNDITTGNDIFDGSKDFCAAHHGAIPTTHSSTQEYKIAPDRSVLFSMSNFCEGVEITEKECMDHFWTAGNSCVDDKIYSEGVRMYGATFMTECYGFSVVPFYPAGRVEPLPLSQCHAITCAPGAEGDATCRSSGCANGCSSDSKCVA